MRKMKKLLSILVAATMTMAMAAPSFAEPAEETAEGTITITDKVDGQEYKAYKLFDLTKSGSNYAYTIKKDSLWYPLVKDTEGLTFTEASSGDLYVITVDEDAEGNPLFGDAQAAALAATLKGNIPTGVQGTDLADVTSLDLGYYFVTSTTGTLCSLSTAEPNITIEEKNEAPTIKKELSDASKDAVAQIGQILDYTVTIDVKAGVKNYIFHDKMSSGLEFAGIDATDETTGVVVTLKRDGQDTVITNANGVSITLDDHATNGEVDCPYAGECAFEVDLSAYDLKAEDQVVIAYQAKVTKDAIETDLVTNEAKLSYGENNDIYTETDNDNTIVTTKTYKFNLVKTDEDHKVLSGAKFRLYGSLEGDDEIPVVKVEDGVYRLAETGETGVDIEAGNVIIKGLDNSDDTTGTAYYLEEVAAPEGYNPLTVRQPVTTVEVNDQNNAVINDGVFDTESPAVEVVNLSGTVLPSTGGIGTTIFYAAGIILMAGAVFFVVRRKRA